MTNAKTGEISPTISPVLRPELLGTGVEDAVAVEKGAVVIGEGKIEVASAERDCAALLDT